MFDRWSVRTETIGPPGPHCSEWVTGPATSAVAGSVFGMQTRRLHPAGSCMRTCCSAGSAGDLCAR